MSDAPSDADWNESDAEFDESAFSGVARLFPLGGVSVLPGIVQPLHVFEERYRALMDDALEGDRLIAMAVLKPGWESDYGGRPPLEETACLGKIVTHQRLADGRYNLLLAGLRRVRIEREVEPPREFRVAEVRLIDEVGPAADDFEGAHLRERLLEGFRRIVGRSGGSPPLKEALKAELPLGHLTDLVAYVLPFEEAVMRELLGEADAAARAQRILARLEEGDLGDAAFPPPFSPN